MFKLLQFLVRACSILVFAQLHLLLDGTLWFLTTSCALLSG